MYNLHEIILCRLECATQVTQRFSCSRLWCFDFKVWFVYLMVMIKMIRISQKYVKL